MKRFIYFLMALLGFGSFTSCEEESNNELAVMYGAPLIHYRVSARVVDSKGNPISGIEVGTSRGGADGISDAEGRVEFVVSEYFDEVVFTDVDKEENGGEFETLTLDYNDIKGAMTEVNQGKCDVKLGDVKLTLKEPTSADN